MRAQMGKLGEADIEAEYKEVQANLKTVGDQLKTYAEKTEKEIKEAGEMHGETRAKVDEMLEPTSRTTFYAETADASRAPAMVEKLDRLAATVPASSRGEIEKAKAAIRYRTEVIRDRVPELEAWLKTNGG